MYFNMIKQIQLFGIDARLIKYSNDAFLVYTYAPYSSKTYNLLYMITSDLDILSIHQLDTGTTDKNLVLYYDPTGSEQLYTVDFYKHVSYKYDARELQSESKKDYAKETNDILSNHIAIDNDILQKFYENLSELNLVDKYYQYDSKHGNMTAKPFTPDMMMKIIDFCKSR